MVKIDGQVLVDQFETFAPKALAHPKDPVGLHFGSLKQGVSKLLVTLDVRPKVVEEAIELGVDFIFSHHPPIFKPVKSFDIDLPQHQMYRDLIKHDITVYAAHTNLDAAEGGMNDWLAANLDLENTEIMEVNQTLDGKEYGYGRVGQLKQGQSGKDMLEIIQETFQVEGLRYVGKDWDQTIERVAIMGGSGADLYTSALEKGADLFITGDISYHTAHDIEESGLLAVDPGHHIEVVCVPYMTNLFKQWSMNHDWSIEVVSSQVDTQPFHFFK